MKSPEIIQESLPTIETLPPESGEAETVYVARFLKKILEVRQMHSQEECLETINNFFDYIINNPLSLNEDTRKIFMQEVERLGDRVIGDFSVFPMQDNHNKIAYFENPRVVRTRNFMSGSKAYIGYLFGISTTIKHYFPGANNAIAGYLKNRLDGKRILNIGGGGSLEDILTQISDIGPGSINPGIIVNVDPYLTKEKIQLGRKKAYRSINISGTDLDIQSKLEREGYPKTYDEIWCLYSLPAYLFDLSELPVFFDNVEKLLASRGTVRLHPLGIAVPSNQSVYSENNLARKDKLRDEVVKLDQLEEFVPSLLPIETDSDGVKFTDCTLLLSRLDES